MRKEKKKAPLALWITSGIVLILAVALCITLVYARVNSSKQPTSSQKQFARIWQEKESRKKKIREDYDVEQRCKILIDNIQTIYITTAEAELARQEEIKRLEEERKAQEEAEAARIAQEQATLEQQQQQAWAQQTETYEQPVYVPSAPAYGNIGRLEIPALGISVPLNSGDDSQGIVDAWDSAYWADYGDGSVLIADHNNQSFYSLGGCWVGATGTINFTGGGSRYITCIAITEGYHDGLVEINGEWWPYVYPGCIMMYTCTYDWQHVTCTIWQ